MIVHNAATMKQNFDPNRLKVLVRSAMVEFIHFLESCSHQGENVDVFSPQHDGNQFQKLTRPNLSDAILGHQEERVNQPAAVALIDYLQQFGPEKMKVLSKNLSGSAQNAYHQLVAIPLHRLWTVKSIEALSLNKVWIPWKLSDAELDQVVAGVLRIEQDKDSLIVVIAPLIGIILDNIDKIEIADGVMLRAWTQAEKAVYLHKNDSYLISLDMFSQLESKCYLQVIAPNSQVFTNNKANTFTTPIRNQLEEFVGFWISRAKWALMQATNPEHLIEELLVTTETNDVYSYSWHLPFRRYSKMLIHASDCIVTEANGLKVAKLLKDLEEAVKVFPDLDDVLWRFDRASLALSPRDVLFESTVGLESLLVYGSGENTRRFKTYGAALVSGGNFEEVIKNLNNIYKLRSDNAHSSKRKLEKVEELSIVARSYLVSIIANVVHLVVTNKITPLIKDGKRNTEESCINRSIERYLTSLMYEAAHKDLQETIN